jgi:ribose 5-phosphate isomerase A
MNELETAKRLAAAASLERVHNGMKLGLGTGSTARHLVELLAERISRENLEVHCCATSKETAELARSLGIVIHELDELGTLDLAIDGADEIDPALNLTKGGGAAHFREKIVEKAAREFVVIADYTKVVPALGSSRKIPLEVLPFAWKTTVRHLEALGATVSPRLKDGATWISDNGNLILDADFGPIFDVASLAQTLDGVTGLLEHGLFVDMAQVAFVAQADGSVVCMEPQRA